MPQHDQLSSLISQQLNRLRSIPSPTQPYLVSSFNEGFDRLLAELVVDYGFDFDKVALHLYYEFPQYQLKITGRTVAVRWWQVEVGRRVGEGRGRNDQGQEQIIQNQNMIQEQQQQQDNMQCQQCPQNHPTHPTPPISSYLTALSHSSTLTQQQLQRPIFYKPKFIIDSQYQLQRYEPPEQPNPSINLDQSQNGSQLLIQNYLKKMCGNQFQYGEFGGWKSQHGKNNSFKGQRKSKDKKLWWVEDNEEDQSEQEQLAQLINQKPQYMKQNINKPQNHHQVPLQPYPLHQSLQNPNPNPNLSNSSQIPNPNNPQPLANFHCYEINQNWDQYESD